MGKLKAFSQEITNSFGNNLDYPERLRLLKERFRLQLEKEPSKAYESLEVYYRELLAWGMITGVDIQNEMSAAKEYFKMFKVTGTKVDISALKKINAQKD